MEAIQDANYVMIVAWQRMREQPQNLKSFHLFLHPLLNNYHDIISCTGAFNVGCKLLSSMTIYHMLAQV